MMNSIAAPFSGVVDPAHPWLGLVSFTEETRAYFHGREEEVAELARRIQRKGLTVLFGQSGLGKTSILQAGIVPRLRTQGYCPVYVRVDYGPDAPSAARQIKDAVLRETALAGSWTQAGVAEEDESLWAFFHHRDDILRDAQGEPLIPLLIFDQFEEIFTLAQGDDSGRRRAADFLEGLAGLVENRPPAAFEASLEEDDTAFERFDFARSDYRVLITLREDYLAHLESLKGDMPSITQNRMRLAPMTGQQALAAVMRPGGKLVSEEVAQAIVRFVAGGAELAHAQVEPSLLSLICRELNDKRVAAGRGEISLDLLAGSHDSILADFYERSLADQPPGVRKVIEDVLLTGSGYRENVAEERLLEALAAAGAAPDARSVLALLVNRRLLRIEERLDVRRVELTHDVLCGVVRASRTVRHEREQQARAERELAVQREREAATRKALVRARRTMAGCLALTVVAVAGAIFGYMSMRQAQKTQAIADSSRASAETLVGYLVDDFYGELAPVGRTDLLDGLTRRTVAYYANLPPEARTRATDANWARALSRASSIATRQAKPDQADLLLGQAIALLQPIVDSGKASEADRIAYADALHYRGATATNRNDNAKGLALMAQGLGVVRPLALAPGASTAVRLSYAKIRTRMGWIKLRESDMAAAQEDLRAARAVLNDPAERADKIPVMIAYLVAGQWLHETLARGADKDYAAAERLAQEMIADAGEVLRKRPDYQPAVNVLNATSLMRAYYASSQGQAGRSLGIIDDAIARLESALRRDPHDRPAADSLAIYLGIRSAALEQLGRPSDALAATDRIWGLYDKVAPVGYQANNLYEYAFGEAGILAEQGDARRLRQAIGRLKEYNGIRIRSMPPHLARAAVLATEARIAGLADLSGDTAVDQAGLDAIVREGDTILSGSGDARSRAMIAEAMYAAEEVRAHQAYARGDYERAEAASRRALRFLLMADPGSVAAPAFSTGLALSLARLHRAAEARALIEPVLKLQRGQIAAGGDDQLLRLQLAKTLFVSALCQRAGGIAELNEAAALLARLPDTLQHYHSVELWRRRIADEIRLHGRSGRAGA
jgi:tetratricopeptide (TPR) repeat protein